MYTQRDGVATYLGGTILTRVSEIKFLRPSSKPVVMAPGDDNVKMQTVQDCR